MSAYRVELLGKDGAVREERLLDCRDDDEATDRAGDLPHPYAMELWQSDRHVAHFPPLLR